MATDSATVDGFDSCYIKTQRRFFQRNHRSSTAEECHGRALTMGGVVKHTNPLPGRFIARGAVVATLENPEFITCRVPFGEARHRWNNSQKEYERQKSLLEGGSFREEIPAEQRLNISPWSKMQSAATQPQSVRRNANHTATKGIQQFLIVRAPISGYVSSVSMNIGKYEYGRRIGARLWIRVRPCVWSLLRRKTSLPWRSVRVWNSRANSLGDKAYDATVISVRTECGSVQSFIRSMPASTRWSRSFAPAWNTARFLKDQK